MVLLALRSTDTVAASDRDSPNVIVVVTDDQGYGDMSCHGNPCLQTPEIDKPSLS